MERWFLLEDGPSSGAYNMAVDEFLLRRSEEEGARPVLRLYSFDPPAITIGFHQDPDKVLDMDAVRRDGIDVVRRVTGGRALLHEGEITYCVSAPSGRPPFAGGLRECFMKISQAIVGALERVGVNAEISGGRPARREGRDVSPCLVSVSRHEITAGGRKIVGSAQRRARGAFIQHGSILVRPASEKISRYLGGDWSSLADRITSVSAETGREPEAGEMESALRESFAIVFDTGWTKLEIPSPRTAGAGASGAAAVVAGRAPIPGEEARL